MPRGKKSKNTAEEIKLNNSPAETAEPKKRGRKKKSETEDSAEISAVPMVEEISEAPAAPKKRGRKPKSETSPAAELAVIDEKPKRRGRKAAAEKIDVPVTEEISEAPTAPKKRSRKSKAETAPAAETVPIDEKPKRRGRKSAADAAPAEPKKRGRKSAAAKTEEKKPTAKKGRKAAEKTPVEAAPVLSPFDRVYNAAYDKIENNINKFVPSAYFAAEITLKGTVEGKFYVHYAESGLDIAPYNYDNADLRAVVDSDILEQMINGTVSFNDAASPDKFEIYGNVPFSTMLALAKLLA